MSRSLARVLLPAALVALVMGGPVSAQQPPPGYQLLIAPQASGGLLLSQRQGVSSATELLRLGFREVGPFFDGRPQVVGGLRDGPDQYAEAAFQGSIRGTPVAGVTFAVIAGAMGRVGFAFDTPNMLPQSLPRLLPLAGFQRQAGTSNCPSPGANWQAVTYPDGSGQVALPAGWRITAANQGTLDAQGPHGRAVVALWVPVLTRAAAAQKLAAQRQISAYVGVPLPETQGLVADPTDPASALVAVRTQLAAVTRQMGLGGGRILRVIETTPVPVQGVGLRQAGFVHVEFEENGLVQRALAYVILGVIDAEQWLYWETSVSAPAACFAQNLPTLAQIATSARTADHVLQARLDRAAQTFREIGDMIYHGNRNRSQQQDRRDENWREQHVGTRIVEDMATGTRTTQDLAHSAELVRRLNQQEGYERYREIPARDLN
jgi:hypothetical protein